MAILRTMKNTSNYCIIALLVSLCTVSVFAFGFFWFLLLYVQCSEVQ